MALSAQSPRWHRSLARECRRGRGMTPTPLLLFAPPGGDIAWAAASIGHCAGMLALPELRLGSAATVDEVLALHARAEDRAGDGLLRTVAQLRFGAQQPDTIDAAAHWLQRRAEWTIAQLLDWLLSHANGRHLVFHEPPRRAAH